MFCSVHNHTEMSNLKLRDSLNKIPAMINKAIEYGFNGLAITDHEVISGHIEALNCGDKIRNEHPDFKIILGNEIYLIDESEYKNADKYWHFILLAKDAKGHEQLRQLSSRAWDRSYVERGQRRTPTFYQDFIDVLGENKGHLIASTACLGGRFATSILRKDSDSINFMISWMIDTFGEGNCFLEMQDSDSDDQQEVNRYIVQLSEFFDIPYIVTQDAHYLDKKDLALFEKFLNSKAESDREVGSFYKYTYMKPESEIHEILSYLPTEVVETAINNTQLIYNQIEYYDLRQDTVVPLRKLPEFQLEHLLSKWYSKYKNIDYFAHSPYAQDRFLLYLIEQGIVEKNFVVTEVEAARIDTELDVLKYTSEAVGNDQRISSYLNLVQEIVTLAWNTSLVGCGRGSACSFLINYLIGIVQVNPLKYNIPYWRFLNKASVPVLTPEEKAAGKVVSIASSMPDCDLDYQPTEANNIMNLMREHYGADNILNCLTYKRESLKSALQMSCRGLGINNDEAQELSALVPMSRGHVYTLKECEEGDEEHGYDPAPQLIKKMQEYPDLYEMVQKVENVITGAGSHASAIYFFNNGFLPHCGVMRTPSGMRITSFDYRGVDAAGGLKMDFLYTDCQSKMAKCLELLVKHGQIIWQGSLKATYDKYLHPDVLDYDNMDMWRKMWSTSIDNLFQFESECGRSCIQRTRPTSVSELGAANAVMRLMAQDGVESPLDKYVRFRNDINEWYKEMDEWGLTPEEQDILKKQLSGSYGVGPEQEDFMELLMNPQISNFSLKEANTARKAIAKKKQKEIDKIKVRFFESADKE